MEDYLTSLKANLVYKESAHLVPFDTCPFLFYNMVPYIFTLANAGWFDWVKRYKKYLSYRKTISRDDFKKRIVNRLYPNEVLVRCPNLHSMVVAGVGLWPQGKIKIRILHTYGLCINGHKSGDEIIIDKSDGIAKALDFNDLFIRTISLAGFSAAKNICKLDTKTTIKTSKIIFPCRYHQKEKEFKSDFLPEGFCIHIFQRIYPYVLATMYNGKIGKELRIDCPTESCLITLHLKKKYWINNRLIKSAEYLFKKTFEIFFYPLDILNYDLQIKVVDIQNKPSQCTLIKDREYPVNLRSKDFICPASFHVLYPYLILASLGNTIMWNQVDKMKSLPCPDCVGTIYSLNKI